MPALEAKQFAKRSLGDKVSVGPTPAEAPHLKKNCHALWAHSLLVIPAAMFLGSCRSGLTTTAVDNGKQGEKQLPTRVSAPTDQRATPDPTLPSNTNDQSPVEGFVITSTTAMGQGRTTQVQTLEEAGVTGFHYENGHMVLHETPEAIQLRLEREWLNASNIIEPTLVEGEGYKPTRGALRKVYGKDEARWPSRYLEGARSSSDSGVQVESAKGIGLEQESPDPQPPRTTATVGGIMIEVVGPARGWTMLEKNEALELLVPSQNRLLAAFGKSDGIHQGMDQAPSWLALLQVAQQGESMQCTPEYFADLVRKIDQSFASTVGEVINEANLEMAARRAAAERPSVVAGTPTMIGSIHRDHNSYCYAMLIPYNDGGANSISICTVALLRLRERLVFAYIYSPYVGDSSVKPNATTGVEWTRALLDKNKVQ